MRDFAMSYIPDLTERFPEGFGGVDMYEPRDPEYEFWCAVEEADRAERAAYTEEDNTDPEPNYWVSFYLQDGTQSGASLYVDDSENAYDIIEAQLIQEYGRDFGGVADYDSYEEMMK